MDMTFFEMSTTFEEEKDLSPRPDALRRGWSILKSSSPLTKFTYYSNNAKLSFLATVPSLIMDMLLSMTDVMCADDVALC
jgi:hypothetical protein